MTQRVDELFEPTVMRPYSVHLRMTYEEKRVLLDMARVQACSVSDVMRRAIRAYGIQQALLEGEEDTPQ